MEYYNIPNLSIVLLLKMSDDQFIISSKQGFIIKVLTVIYIFNRYKFYHKIRQKIKSKAEKKIRIFSHHGESKLFIFFIDISYLMAMMINYLLIIILGYSLFIQVVFYLIFMKGISYHYFKVYLSFINMLVVRLIYFTQYVN